MLEFVRGDLYVTKKVLVIEPPLTVPRIVAIRHINEKVNTTGELNVIFSFFILSYSLLFYNLSLCPAVH